jgi:hypothetical protein
MKERRDYNEKYVNLYKKYSREEITYFKNLNNENKNKIYEIEKEIDDYKSFKEPLRFKFLFLNTSVANKIAILRKCM